MHIPSLLGAAALTATLAGSALAADFKAGNLVIHDPWTRATPRGAPVAGGYAVIENTGDQPDSLTGGSFSASSGFSIHQMTMKDGVMSMGPVEGGLEIPAHGSVKLDPSGFHLMFTGLTRQLKRHETVGGTLVFKNAGTVSVDYAVGSIGARGPEHSGH
ncbi:copper chaperone PCu(A)C [Labrys monachus]|uniref:Copper(I)-binding protein n=1 Tax=Labrys monachus TaxID=217067 RepID=A0ABU0FKJ1_9HYPH|nr:copper chaperone PCu(A)C [Labrys monachus]MDQ0395125.1 copper(I)-binding protein [Labrys monachus]